MVGIRLLKFLRMLLRYKICAFGITLIHPGMAAECTAGNIVTRVSKNSIISPSVSLGFILYFINNTTFGSYSKSF